MLVRINIFSLTLLKSIIKGLPLRNPPFFNIGDISFGEMIRRKAIRREEGGKPYLLPSIIFHFYLFIIQRLDPSSIETFKGINGGVALPSSMGVEDKRSPVKVLRGRETGRSLVCHPCSSTLSLFFFSKKIGDEEDTIRCRFSFFFFFFDSNITYRFRFAIERRFFTLWRVLDHRTNEIGFNMHWYFVIQVEWQPFFFFWRRDDQWSNLGYLGYTT